ncbi:MAG: bifunctional nuclease family protein [Deltaproteobacteria bacterium]|nr:bifunctional nuclease family protein [Deltaproteobacteria bacterium]MBI2341644.1 bifunctional nuclease family protein [Deltaproteobacteria bacterium]
MYVEMKVTGLTIDPFTSMPIIILKDMEEKAALPIWIGLIEASAIATELEHIQLARPMTHDLLKNIMDSVGIKVIKAAITELRDNTFYAKVVLDNAGKEIEMDARPSDAIAIALRTKSPIFVEKSVVEKSRKIDLTLDDGEQKKRKWTEILESLSPDDFGKYKM